VADLGEAKRIWRRRLSRARASLGPAARSAAHERQAAHLAALIGPPTSGGTLGVYAAIGSEADPARFAEWWWSRGGRLAYPRVARGGGAMMLVHAEPADLVPGAHGVPAPPDELPAVALDAVAALIVPGLGFDRLGGRLGRGGGHYDRLLAPRPPQLLVVGLAYAVQVVAAVPRGGHDRDVDALVTERGVARGGRWIG